MRKGIKERCTGRGIEDRGVGRCEGEGSDIMVRGREMVVRWGRKGRAGVGCWEGSRCGGRVRGKKVEDEIKTRGVCRT